MDAPRPGGAAKSLRGFPFLAGDPELSRMDQQIRMAIRDALHRCTRKPFAWGGLAGYQQLESIDQALVELTSVCPVRPYFQQLAQQVQRVLDKNRTLANNVKEAHQWLRQIAAWLRYPPGSDAEAPVKCPPKPTPAHLEPVWNGAEKSLQRFVETYVERTNQPKATIM